MNKRYDDNVTGRGDHAIEGMSEGQQRLARLLEIPVLIAVLATIPVLILHTMHFDGWGGIAVTAAGALIWLVFLVEAAVMLWIAPDRKRWIRHNVLDLAIVVLTPPFLPGGLQVLWVLRLLRILDVMPVIGRVFQINGFRYVAILAFLAVFGGGLAFAEIEREQDGVNNAFDGIWWAMVTISTTGYGDLFPETAPGRVLGMLVMCVGPVLVGMIAASATQLLQQQIDERIDETRETIKTELDDVEQELGDVEQAIGEVGVDVDELEGSVAVLARLDERILEELSALRQQNAQLVERVGALESGRSDQ